jgi:hypothetical protein
MSAAPRIRLRRTRTRLLHALGEGRRLLAGAAPGPRAVLLVIGCQRSGTTLMTDLLARDPAAKVYPEHSAISSRDRHGLRLAPIPAVAARLARSRFPLVVMKPLVESQNARALLDGLPRARGLWMFRHYADVARSNLARFGEGNGIKNLRSIARGVADWRGEGASEEVSRRVREHFSETMNPSDAAALFWWARNALFFEQALDARDDVLTCRYEELVADSVRELRRVYAFSGCAFPDPASAAGVSSASVGRGRDLPLSSEVVALCEKMLARLESAHAQRPPCG